MISLLTRYILQYKKTTQNHNLSPSYVLFINLKLLAHAVLFGSDFSRMCDKHDIS